MFGIAQKISRVTSTCSIRDPELAGRERVEADSISGDRLGRDQLSAPIVAPCDRRTLEMGRCRILAVNP